MIKVKVCLYGDADLLYKCYKPEIQKKDRSSFSLRKNKDNVEFNIKAKDDTALKATINSIFKLFIVYNKLRRTKKKMVEISKDAQEKISQLQLLEQNLQNLLLQRQQFQAQLTEIESAFSGIFFFFI